MTRVDPSVPLIGKRATTSDVARLAGVSRTTVSEIFNGRDSRFPAATVHRVREAAAQLRYVPSPAAQFLKTGRSTTVLVIVPNLPTTDEFHGLIDGLSAMLDEEGLHIVVLFQRQDSPTGSDDILRLHPVGVIDLGVLGRDSRELLRSSGVVVVPEPTGQDFSRFQRQIGRLVMERLVREPARRFFYAGSSQLHSDRYDAARIAGMNEVAAERGVDPPTVVDVPLDLATAMRTLMPFLESGPVGVGCYTDSVAMAVLAVARRARLEVPDHVAVVGVDATPEGQLFAPRLTSVRNDAMVIGAEVGRALVDALAGRSAPSSAAEFGALTLLEGESG